MLVTNACMAPNCHYYGKSMQKLNHHFDIWKNYPHGFHEFIKENRKLTVNDIYSKFIADRKYDDSNGIFGYTKDEVLEYISKLKEVYEKHFN